MRNVWPSDGRLADLGDAASVATLLGGVEVGGVVAVVHEEHVDVGRVRQLGAAEAAHADHRERHRRLERRQRGLERTPRRAR